MRSGTEIDSESIFSRVVRWLPLHRVIKCCMLAAGGAARSPTLLKRSVADLSVTLNVFY